jgi:hypothetical protein
LVKGFGTDYALSGVVSKKESSQEKQKKVLLDRKAIYV